MKRKEKYATQQKKGRKRNKQSKQKKKTKYKAGPAARPNGFLGQRRNFFPCDMLKQFEFSGRLVAIQAKDATPRDALGSLHQLQIDGRNVNL